MNNNQNQYTVVIQKCKMDFPKIEWDSIDPNLSTVLETNNPFKGKNAFSLADLCSNNAQLGLIEPNHKYEGIDLPVLLSKKESSDDTIMIIGESPVRDTRKLNNPGLYIGTPFAVAGLKDVPTQCNIYKYIFCHLLNKRYKVYITDAVKVWYNGLGKKDFIKEFRNNKYNQKILKSEIDIIGPKLIVTWGETAKKACEIIEKEIPQKFLPTIHQTHPVRLNWDRWKVEMLSDTIRDGKCVGIDYINDNKQYPDKDSIYLSYYIAQEILTEAKKR